MKKREEKSKERRKRARIGKLGRGTRRRGVGGMGRATKEATRLTLANG